MNGEMSGAVSGALAGLAFESPGWLWLIPVWLFLVLLFAAGQLRTLRWLRRHVAPRFQGLFTRFLPASPPSSRRRLAGHLAVPAVLGLLLLGAAAGPYLPGAAGAPAKGGPVIFLIDASASMMAGDVGAFGLAETGSRPAHRLMLARRIARALVESLPDRPYAVVSFSGEATLHLPAVRDAELVKRTVDHVEWHNFYTTSGSSFAEALDTALALIQGGFQGAGHAGSGPSALSPSVLRGGSWQAVLLSDGEIPAVDDDARELGADLGPPLDALAKLGVPVHTVALGTPEGEGRLLWDGRDVLSGKPKEEWRKLLEFHTRREEVHLQRISRATGGVYGEVHTTPPSKVLERLAEAVEEHSAPALPRGTGAAGGAEGAGRRALAPWLLGLFLLLYLADALLLDRPRPVEISFDLDRVGRGRPALREGAARGKTVSRGTARLLVPSLLAPLFLTSLLPLQGCGGPAADLPGSDLWRAHRENEAGILRDAVGDPAGALPHFERSRAYGVRAEIPTHNLARSTARAGDPAAAHLLYQQALEIDPDLLPALYNDGHALHDWGRSLLDPKGCEVERTRELWQAARRRFAEVLERSGGEGPLARRARTNRDALDDHLRTLDNLLAHPPACCSEGGDAGAGEGESGENEEQAGGDSEGGGEDERNPDAPPPPPAGPDGEDGQSGEENRGDASEGEGSQGEASEGEGAPENGNGGGGSTLSDAERQEIAGHLARIAQRHEKEELSHRRTRAEQFRGEDVKKGEGEPVRW